MRPRRRTGMVITATGTATAMPITIPALTILPRHAGAAEPKGPVAWWMLPLWVVATAFGQAISFLIFLIEFFGTFIKSGVLAFRLFINIFAGHIVSASILTMVVVLGEVGITWIWGFATAITVLGVTLLGLLELFVAFLQAYVFTFLTAVFTGMAMHPSH